MCAYVYLQSITAPLRVLYLFSQVYRISEAPPAPASALPIGMTLPRDHMVASRVPPTQLASLLHHLLAVVRPAQLYIV